MTSKKSKAKPPVIIVEPEEYNKVLEDIDSEPSTPLIELEGQSQSSTQLDKVKSIIEPLYIEGIEDLPQTAIEPEEISNRTQKIIDLIDKSINDKSKELKYINIATTDFIFLVYIIKTYLNHFSLYSDTYYVAHSIDSDIAVQKELIIVYDNFYGRDKELKSSPSKFTGKEKIYDGWAVALISPSTPLFSIISKYHIKVKEYRNESGHIYKIKYITKYIMSKPKTISEVLSASKLPISRLIEKFIDNTLKISNLDTVLQSDPNLILTSLKSIFLLINRKLSFLKALETQISHEILIDYDIEQETVKNILYAIEKELWNFNIDDSDDPFQP